MNGVLASFSHSREITTSSCTSRRSHETASAREWARRCHSRSRPNRTARSARSRSPACSWRNPGAPPQAPARGQPHGSRRSSRLLGAAVAIAVGAGALQIYSHYAPVQSDGEALPRSIADDRRPAPQRSRYQCDGRVYCSEMTSCAEARFFLKNCRGVKMDGNHDGEPCEQQWCN